MINEINSKQYWNCRFQSGDWKQYDGDKQSVFFYTLACTAMSEPLRTDLERNAFHFVDYGCALGDGTAFLAHRFPSCSVTGIDFSDAAIQEASEKYPQCSFEIGDITQPLPKADVVFSSNTLEHLQDPLPILHSLDEVYHPAFAAGRSTNRCRARFSISNRYVPGTHRRSLSE